MEHLGPPEDATAAEVEAQVLPRARAQTPSGLRVSLARAVLAADPAAAERRRQGAVGDRTVTLFPERDGMAGIYARLPAPEALRVHQALTNAANTLVSDHVGPPCTDEDPPADSPATTGTGDDRSMDQRRADALIDLVLDHQPSRRAQWHGARGCTSRPRWGSGPTTVHVTVA